MSSSSLSILFLCCLVFFSSSSFPSSYAQEPSCGTYGPTQWLNQHISLLVRSGIGAPFSNRVASFPRFFDFFGGETFPGVFGCTPTKLGYYSDDTASLKYRKNSPLVASMNADQPFQEEEDSPSSFGTLTIEYEECRPVNSQKYFNSEIEILVKSYKQFNPSYPEGSEVFFYYDEQCRVQSLEEKNLADGQIVYSSNFTYESSAVSWLPTSVKSFSALATTLLNFDYQEVTPEGLITKFSSAKFTAQLESELDISSPRIEEWNLSYSPSTSLLERAQISQRSILGKSFFTFFFEYDSTARWTRASSAPGLLEKKTSAATIGTRAFYQGSKLRRLQMYQGSGARLQLDY